LRNITRAHVCVTIERRVVDLDALIKVISSGNGSELRIIGKQRR
jgi:hypothetical protein